jgi:predicted cupin superfamily sugar epimerase
MERRKKMSWNADAWIRHLQLQPHPEGGYFREIYRSEEEISADHLPSRFTGGRCFSTAIYFLLRNEQISALHRLKSDEVWHFYEGSTIVLYMFHECGDSKTVRLGRQPELGESLQVVIPAGWWFGAHIETDTHFSLIGCTVSPGFNFRDFEMGKREELLQKFPQHQAWIERLTY